ncbi:hypothetical protein [Desulfobaculum sp.]
MGRTRRMAIVSVLALVSLVCLGMGSMGQSVKVTKVPEPDRLFTAEVVDAEDTSYTVRDFSVEGLTLVPVTLGKAEVSIDFAAIRSVEFQYDEPTLAAVVTYRDGSTRKVRVEPGVNFYGRTKWGMLRLAARDVRRVTFVQQEATPAP